jgi:hypothetical protein
MVLANPSQLQLTAFHEAGHFTFALGLGPSRSNKNDKRRMEPSSISIRPDENSTGRVTWHEDRDAPVGQRPIRAHIVVLLAGPMVKAHRLALAAAESPDITAVMAKFQETARGQPDLSEAKELALSLQPDPDDARDLLKDIAQQTAVKVVRRKKLWRVISTLAAAVLEFEELDWFPAAWVVSHAVHGETYPSMQMTLREHAFRDWDYVDYCPPSYELVRLVE